MEYANAVYHKFLVFIEMWNFRNNELARYLSNYRSMSQKLFDPGI